MDDVGALAMLHALADRGEAQILAMMVSAKNPYAAACANRINTYFGRPELPIGQLKGDGHIAVRFNDISIANPDEALIRDIDTLVAEEQPLTEANLTIIRGGRETTLTIVDDYD